MKELEYDSQYSILKDQIRVLGGDPDISKPDSCYEAQLEILRLLEEGGESVTPEQVHEIVEEYNYTTMADVEAKGYVTDADVEAKGYVTDADVEAKGYTTMADVEAKGYLTEHQPLKTINGESIVGEGNIEIKGGGDTEDHTLTFTTTGTGTTISFARVSGSSSMPNIEYNLDNAGWTLWDGSQINLPVGSTVKFRGVNPDGFSNWKFVISIYRYAKVKVTGDMYSLIDGVGAPKEYTHKDTPALQNLFYSIFANTGILYGPYLNAYTSATYQFLRMFSGCTLLESVEYINITGSANDICTYMFSGCTSLADASNVFVYCSGLRGGWNIFEGCTSLAVGPHIVSAGRSAFNNAFNGCTSIQRVYFDTTTCGDYTFDNAFNGAPNIGVFSFKNTPTSTILNAIKYANWHWEYSDDQSVSYKYIDATYVKTNLMTQAEYDALEVKDPNTLYIITDAE